MENLIALAAIAIAVILSVLFKRRWNERQRLLEQTTRELADLRAEHKSLSEQLHTLAQVASDGLVLLDARTQVVFMNDAAKALLNISNGVGRSLEQIAWGFNLQPLVSQVLRYGEPMGQTILTGERTFSVRVHPSGNAAQRGAWIALSEITELQRLGRARREFVANISHELRTPITTLRLLAETISEDTLRNRPLTLEYVSKIRAQIDLLHQLTEELMDLAVIESGQSPIKLVEACVNDLVNEALEPLRPQAERKKIVLNVDVPPDLRVLADPQGIRKVLGNLIHNATKFTNADGKIDIRAAPCGNDVEFSVADNGIGIPASDLPRIFERFYKVDRARTREQGELRGTGLGLAIAKHIVEAHGGSIRAESKEDKGTTIYFTLPRA